MPLEFNLDKLNAISYDKGCYIGQVGGRVRRSTMLASGWAEGRGPAGRQAHNNWSCCQGIQAINEQLWQSIRVNYC